MFISVLIYGSTAHTWFRLVYFYILFIQILTFLPCMFMRGFILLSLTLNLFAYSSIHHLLQITNPFIHFTFTCSAFASIHAITFHHIFVYKSTDPLACASVFISCSIHPRCKAVMLIPLAWTVVVMKTSRRYPTTITALTSPILDVVLLSHLWLSRVHQMGWLYIKSFLHSSFPSAFLLVYSVFIPRR